MSEVPVTPPVLSQGSNDRADLQVGLSDESSRSGSTGESTDEPSGEVVIPGEDRKLSPLSTLTRVFLLIVGWLLLLVGVAGLILPGIQGILTIVAGAAVLSLASELVYRIIHRALGRWPRILGRMERIRAKIHSWVSRE